MSVKQIPSDLFYGKKVLDIGCGRNKIPGAVGLDQINVPGVDIAADLNKKLPIESSSYDIVNANQVLEHVENITGLIYEVHRILTDDGLFIVHAPYFRSSWAHIDPTHVRCFTINSMDYFVKGTFCYENYRFQEEAFNSVEIFLDNDYPKTFFRRLFSYILLKNPMKYENTFISTIYPFQQITYLLRK